MGELVAEQMTRLLGSVQRGDGRAAGELLPLIYEQLRQLAAQRMAMERKGHTLDATALVHEAYLRLVGDRDVKWAGRAHFFHAAAEAMRRILIEHARARQGMKRGGGRRRVPLSIVDLADDEQVPEILALDDAISRLERVSAGAAEVVRPRIYAGLSVSVTAEGLGVSQRTVAREWACARAWLFRELGYE